MDFNIFKSYKLISDEDLMLLMRKKNNEKAFEELYNRYNKKLINFSLRIVGHKEQAEDIVHDSFFKIINNPDSFRTSQKFSTWIFTIVKNASLTVIRNETHREKLRMDNFIQIPTADLVTTMDAKLLQNKINQLYKELSEKEQMIFILRFENKLSLKEIASIIQVPEGSVKSCLFYLLKKLSTQLSLYQKN